MATFKRVTLDGAVNAPPLYINLDHIKSVQRSSNGKYTSLVFIDGKTMNITEESLAVLG